MAHLVSKDLLDLYDKYDGDLGLLDERGAPKKDRQAFGAEQIQTLGEYVDELGHVKVACLSSEFRNQLEERILELEQAIAPEVVEILKARIKPHIKND